MSSINTRCRLWSALLLPLLAMLLWGSLFPMIKIGYAAFGMDTSCVPNISCLLPFVFLSAD